MDFDNDPHANIPPSRSLMHSHRRRSRWGRRIVVGLVVAAVVAVTLVLIF